MKKLIKLSYDINPEMPLFPGTPPVSISRHKDISKGDSSNTFLFTMQNHSGTHIDAPRHSYEYGKNISDYSLKDLFFENPMIIDCHKEAEGSISVEDLSSLSTQKEEFDILLIRTGFSRYRKNDPDLYSNKNPFLSPEAAEWLRGKFPNLKALGVDCISITSCVNREAGRKSHKILLDDTRIGSSPVLIVEDLDLSLAGERLDNVMVAPIFIEGLDSAPCTAIGVIDD